MPEELKRLIDLVDAKTFAEFFQTHQGLAEQEEGSASSTLGGILDSGYYKLVASAADDNFRAFAAAGYTIAIEELAIANSHEKAQIVLLRHITVGMSLGFKYAQYLQDNKELSAVALGQGLDSL